MYGSTLIGKTTKTTGFLSVVCYFQSLRLFFSLDKSMLRHFYRIHCPNKLRKGGICGLKPWRFCFFFRPGTIFLSTHEKNALSSSKNPKSSTRLSNTYWPTFFSISDLVSTFQNKSCKLETMIMNNYRRNSPRSEVWVLCWFLVGTKMVVSQLL